MLQNAQGAFVVIGLNTSSPMYFWNGVKLPGIISLHASVDNEDTDNKLKLRAIDIHPLYAEMRLAGITVKKV